MVGSKKKPLETAAVNEFCLAATENELPAF